MTWASYVAVATVDLDVGQLLSGVEPEVTSFHNMLVPMLDCPDATGPAPASGPLSPGFFRSVSWPAPAARRLRPFLTPSLP